MRRANPLLFAALAVLLLAARSVASLEIPFSSRAGMIWLKVAVAGHPEPLDFLLDSGASATVLDLSAASRCGVKLGRRETVQSVQGPCAAYRVKGIAASVGGVPIASSMVVLDLSAVSLSAGKRIDGLLGADFFRRRIVQIDSGAGRLRLLDRAEIGANAGEAIPLVTRNGAMCIRVGIGGNAAGWMRVDTGCNALLEWAPTPRQAKALSGGSAGFSPGSVRRISAEVQLGSHRLAAVDVGVRSRAIFEGEAGLVGNGILSKFIVTLDAAKGRLFLAKRNPRS